MTEESLKSLQLHKTIYFFVVNVRNDRRAFGLQSSNGF